MKHVSSFIGNVGDILSNYAFSTYLAKKGIGGYEKLEIRDFYQNVVESKRRSFDKLFEECQVNQETLVIGGGGFLDYWVDSSRTATTIDVDLELLAKTDFKLIISSIGSFPHKYVSLENQRRFVQFMTVLSKRKNTHIMLRNDGSYKELEYFLPKSVLDTVFNGADNAYLLEQSLEYIQEKSNDYVVFNVASDQLFMQSKYRGEIDYHHFKSEIVKSVNYVIEKLNKKVVFVPHLLSDVKFYVELCEELNELLVRGSVTIFIYSGQEQDMQSYIDIYASSYANICTRLHSNILSAMLNKKTISLCVLDRVRAIASQHANLTKVTEFEASFSQQIIESLDQATYSRNATHHSALLDEFYSLVL